MSNIGFNKFQGDVKTEKIKYLADPQLRNIVNVAIALARPLLVKGEPGTGNNACTCYSRKFKQKVDNLEH